jgi:hypothetical protein
MMKRVEHVPFASQGCDACHPSGSQQDGGQR